VNNESSFPFQLSYRDQMEAIYLVIKSFLCFFIALNLLFTRRGQEGEGGGWQGRITGGRHQEAGRMKCDSFFQMKLDSQTDARV